MNEKQFTEFEAYVSAFPIPDVYSHMGEHREGQKGLTKREYVACVCLRGILSNQKFMNNISDTAYPPAEIAADMAVEYADALLKRLGRGLK